MKVVCGMSLMLLACTAASGAAAEGVLSLDELKWKHRILLLPERVKSEDPAGWMAEPQELVERHLILFRENDGVYRQWFPKTRTPVTLRLSEKTKRRVTGKVTLIGKDGGVKRQWKEEKRGVRTQAFSLIDSMPMRQREMRE